MLDEPAAVAQESVVLETVVRAATQRSRWSRRRGRPILKA
jgi:hypothetical protein